MRFDEARQCVIDAVRLSGAQPEVITIPLSDASGRGLARPVRADRDYPLLPRSIRDGFAVRAADTPGELRVIGEVQAGAIFDGEVGPGECVEIMTGARIPHGA